MRIMIDTNVLISAIIFPESLPAQATEKVIDRHILVLCSHIVDELHQIFEEKFKDKIVNLEKFLHQLSFDFIYTPKEIKDSEYPHVRDKADLPVLVSAIEADVDLFITGDKDFFAIRMDKPEVITPKEFVDYY